MKKMKCCEYGLRTLQLFTKNIKHMNYLQKFKISGPGMLLVCSAQEIGGATADES
jgi:hypothetical protein